MFPGVRNPQIIVRKSENEGKHLFGPHFCFLLAPLKGPFRPKAESLKIDIFVAL